jgi:hypothetical protein
VSIGHGQAKPESYSGSAASRFFFRAIAQHQVIITFGVDPWAICEGVPLDHHRSRQS